MSVLVFGTYDDGAHPRTRVLRQGLEASGVEVHEHNVSLGVPTSERVRTLEHPRRLPLLLGRILRCWARLVVRTVTDRHPRPDAVFVGYLGHFDVLLARLLHPRATIALDYLIAAADTARSRGAGNRVVLRLLDTLDRLACAAADVVVVDTAENLATVPAAHRHKAVVVPVGASEEWFSRPPQEPAAAGRSLTAVFFGLFASLHGAPVILEALRLAAERGVTIEATIIGTGQTYRDARQVAPDSHVRWVPWVEPEDLPSIVAEHDLCFGIFGDVPKAQRVVPNKAYQGAAAGCLVVTSDTREQRAALPAATVFAPPGDASALADVLCTLPPPDELLSRRHDSYREALKLFTPAACVAPLLSALQAAPSRSRTGSATGP